MKMVQVFQHHNWVRAGEHVALRVGSLMFSMVSAHAILWFYDSLAKVDNSDPIQQYVPYVIAGGFGLLGYFVSRGLVYRMIHNERIRVYIAISALFEFVEIVCNFAQAVSSVPKVQWLLAVQGSLHAVLLFLLYLAYSIVPVVTFVLAVVDMDLEKAKNSAGYAPSSRAVGNALPVPRSFGAPNRQAAPAAVPPLAALPMRGNPAHAPAAPAVAGTGWKFPFKSSTDRTNQPGTNAGVPSIAVE